MCQVELVPECKKRKPINCVLHSIEEIEFGANKTSKFQYRILIIC